MKPSEDDPPFPKIAWRITIIDIAQNSQEGQDVEQYCAQVKQWARSILEQMSSLPHDELGGKAADERNRSKNGSKKS